MQQNREIIDNCHTDLALVVSVAEVCERWHKTYKTVIIQIDKGNIIARKSGRAGKTWLLAVESVIALWGEAKEGY